MTQLKVRQIGNSLGVVLPKEILARLNVKSGDSLHLTEADGSMQSSLTIRGLKGKCVSRGRECARSATRCANSPSERSSLGAAFDH